MSEGIFVPPAASEIEEGLMKVFRAAVAGSDAVGAALVAQELRARSTETKKNNRVAADRPFGLDA